MKKVVYLIAFIAFFGVKSFAQEKDKDIKNDKNAGKIEALKIAYITKKLNLSPEEAQRFWPVYNKYVDEIKSVNQEQKQSKMPEIEREEKILNIRKKYNSEFNRTISADKVNTLFGLEKDFRQMVQKELQERRQLRDRQPMNRPRMRQ